ncbi:glycosyltransferase AglD [Nanobdella aerobiophila]|uniref:Glycosyltransferase AglD n=1 Tax=Nanobdella aerobiophila TaxID=2586965 RepID=A0A915SSN6_9ARCH|nr:glycosyltransferase [Nanobdella aerobiophila]BBL45516.1 glycosyltransferase AglD [Nanobdella aerobiophila]
MDFDDSSTLIIIPAYNEEKRISKCLDKYIKTGFHILVVFDGNDNTDKIVLEYSKKYKNIHLLKFENKLGKGGAIIEGIKWGLKNKYKYFILSDADASIDYLGIKKIREKLNKYDFVYTKRLIKNYPLYRKILSKIYVLLNWILLPETLLIDDIQSGYKGFNYRTAYYFVNNSIITGFAYDSNMFVDAFYHRSSINKIYVYWKYDEESIFIKKLLKNISAMFFSLTKIRIYYSPFRFMLNKLKPAEGKIYSKVK